jgi:hypothetical protein
MTEVELNSEFHARDHDCGGIHVLSVSVADCVRAGLWLRE